MAICARCGQEITGHHATSRVDSKTKLCPDCGTTEAWDVYAMSQAGILRAEVYERLKLKLTHKEA